MEPETSTDTRPGVGAVVLVVVLAVAAAVAVSYGLARDERLWLLVGAVVFAPVLVASTHGAARMVTENPRSAGLAACTLLTLVFVVVVVVVEPWWARPSEAHGGTLVLAAADPTAHVYLRRVPAGAELSRRHDPAPLVSGKEYAFSCEVVLGDRTVWLRLADEDYWAPGATLVTTVGRRRPSLPTC